MFSSIHEFCEERKIPSTIEQAFTAYVKAVYSSSLAVRPGETLTKIITNLTREKVEEMWLKFVLDLKNILTPPSSP
jgi:hypothetical protein